MDDMYHNDYQEPEQKGIRFWFILGALGVLLVILIISAVFLINSEVKQKNYKVAFLAGNKFYKEGNYQNAIQEYKKALQYDKDQEGAYLNLASAYIALGDYSSANSILELGVSLMESSRLKEKKKYVEQMVWSTTGEEDGKIIQENLTIDEIVGLSEQVTLENSMFDMVANYTYSDYYRDFGQPVHKSADGGKVGLNYDKPRFTTIYYDIDGEEVVEGEMPYATVKPCEVSFADLTSIFNSGNKKFAVSKEKLQQLFGDQTKFLQKDGSYMMVAEYKDCRVTIETDSNGNIVSSKSRNQLEPLRREVDEVEEVGKGRINGYIQNAMTGAGMAATMNFRERGQQSGTILATIQSSAMDGSYTYEGDAGTYTVEVMAEGYITEYMDVEIVESQVRTAEAMVLSPTITASEMRIVLTWGVTPYDLDSHTDGISSGGSTFDIDFRNKEAAGVGNLDVDDTNGYGPETTTMMDMNAVFDFYVVDFGTTGMMASSGAVVKVYLNDQIYSFEVPSGQGNRWDVFHYENGKITTINSLY